MSEFITTTWSEVACTVAFNRDNKKNAFSTQMSVEVSNVVDDAEKRGLPIVLTANPGSSVWSAGHDLTEIHNPSDLANDTMFDLMQKLIQCKSPVISRVDGGVFGGGFLLTLISDIVLATSGSQFCMPINKMGIPLPLYFYRFGVAVLGLHKAKEVFLAALPMTAEDAYGQGLVNHLAENAAEMDRQLEKILHGIQSCLPNGLAYTKAVFNTIVQHAMSGQEAGNKLELEYDALLRSKEVIERIAVLTRKIQKKDH